MPKLEKWTAQNPVLYYKQFLANNSLNLSTNQINEIGKKMHLTNKEYQDLGDRDIIVVRTPKFE